MSDRLSATARVVLTSEFSWYERLRGRFWYYGRS
jgi:hypothetical protein